jgi:hypothetical protein
MPDLATQMQLLSSELFSVGVYPMRKSCFVLALTLCVGAAAQTNFVYTDDSGFPNTVSAFRVNGDGSLTLIPGSPFPTGGNGGMTDVNPGKITTATKGESSFLYAANNSDETISAFRIDPATGQLTAVPGSPFPSGSPNPNANFSLASSPDGEFLFATDEATDVIHVFAIHQNGVLSERPQSPFFIGAVAEGLKVTANGRFVVAGLTASSAVAVFAIRADGTLSAVPGSPFPGGSFIRDVAVNCASNLVFASSSGQNVINAYHMAGNGTLTPVAGSPFSSGGNFVSALTLSPDNQNLFDSNIFDSTASSLAVHSDGSLQPIVGSPFATSDFLVGGLETTQAGNFLYVALVGLGSVDAFSVGAGGVLTPVPGRPFFTGQSQVFVLSLTTFPAPRCGGGVD